METPPSHPDQLTRMQPAQAREHSVLCEQYHEALALDVRQTEEIKFYRLYAILLYFFVV